MRVVKGKPTTVDVGFKSKGIAVSFSQPPSWILTNSTGRTLLQGTAVPNGTKWSATFTVSTNYVVPNNEEELEIEFTGRSAAGREMTATRTLTLSEPEDTYKPIGIVYSLITTSPLVDTFYSPTNDVASIDYRIFAPDDTLLYTHPTITSPVLLQNTKKGYEYKIDLGRPSISSILNYNDALVGVLEYYTASSTDAETEIHPIYGINAKIASHCSALKQYLDKAQLIEIDPSLQWSLPEMIHYLQEGIKHINAATTTTMTAWTVSTYPQAQLQQYLFAAATLYALNARYLAEGFNTFNFSGLNTTLEYDRRDTITYKIEEMRAYLEGLPAAKAAVIAAGYATGSTLGSAATGLLGLQGSGMSNKVSRNLHKRRFY